MTTPDTQPSKWLIFMKDSILLMRQDIDALPNGSDIADMHDQFIRRYELGKYHGHTLYCAELITDLPPENTLLHLIPLRGALEHLGDQWYSAATKAFSIINWDRNHQYCGRCGHVTSHTGPTFERVCTGCHLQFYPRISPSVIVLIQKGDEILMARGHHFKPGVYGLIAGFVDAGESIEQAVHREVYEETRLIIKNLRYFGSQPWPFPDSLMMGFFADYASGEIIIDPIEIAEAGWYPYHQLPGRPGTKLSIASKMLDHFLSQQKR